MSTALNRRAALLAVLIATTGAGAADAAGKRPELDVAALLPRLPSEVFDYTTEGLEEGELRVLHQRGESKYWKINRRTPQKVVFVAKFPFSEVHLRSTHDGKTAMIEALTFNEKVIHYAYWTAKAATGPLKPYEPGAVFRLFNEREDGEPGVSVKDAPKAIVTHAALREQCARSRKESGATSAQKASPGCEDLPAKADALRQQFAKEPRWVEIIDRIGQVVGEESN